MKRLIVLVSALLLLAPTALAQEGAETLCLVTDLGRVNDGTFNQAARCWPPLTMTWNTSLSRRKLKRTSKPISKPA